MGIKLILSKNLDAELTKLKNKNNISESEAIALYNKAVKLLDKEFFEKAYNIDDSKSDQYLSDPLDIMVNLDNKVGNMYYISTNIWGFDPNTTLGRQRDKMIVSESTMYLLNKMFPDRITHFKVEAELSDYKRAHYHTVIIRMRQFRYINEFKWLKIHYLRLNDEVFEGKLRTDIITTAYNYGVDDKSNYNRASAFHWKHGDVIAFNGRYNMLQNKNLNRYTKSIFIHEMCHEYADTFLGGTWEPKDSRETWGDVMYGIHLMYGDQIRCHGLRFGTAAQLAADHCEFSFKEILGYGIGRIKNEHNSGSSLESTLVSDLYSSYASYRNNDTAENTKQWYMNTSQYISDNIQRYINSARHNCNVQVVQDTDALGRNHVEPNIDNAMVPLAVFIQNNNGFNEKYKIAFEFNRRGNVRVTLYRDFMQQYKGYELDSRMIKLNATQKDLEALIRAFGSKITKDLEEV